MNKIFSTLNDPKNWIEAFLDNRDNLEENEVKALEFINNQKFSDVYLDEYDASLSFAFEYENFNDLPEELRNGLHVNEDDDPCCSEPKFFPFLDWCGCRACIFLYDVSENSYYSYEEFMHSLGENDKKYIIINISFD